MKKYLIVVLMVFFSFSYSYAGNVDTYGIGAKATALGGAFSAYADDPFAAYYNPAGLTQINSFMLSAGVEIIDPTLKAHDYSATDSNGGTLVTKSFNDTSDTLVVPHFGAAIPLTERIYFGIAGYVPYGLHVKWDDDPAKNPGAYNSFESYYVRIVTTPTLAFKLSDKLSVGFGVSIGRSESGTYRRIYNPSMPSLHNRTVKSDLTDDTNYSYNVGIMYKPSEKVSIGLTYRSRTDTHFTGTVEVTGYDKVGASVDIDHPEQVQVGIRYTPIKRISIEGDVVWTRWSIIDDYTVHFNRPLLGKNEENFYRNWKDTRQVRIGVEWKTTDLLTLRCGYFYDPSPIRDDSFDLQWPDADKKTYSVGAGLNFGKISVDFVVQYSVAEYKREIGGESEELNNSYADPLTGQPGRVSLGADGHLWGYGITLNYKY